MSNAHSLAPGQKVMGINISNRLRKNYVFPAAGFMPFPDTHGYAEYQDNTPPPPEKLEIDSSRSLVGNNGWSIEYASFGVRYAAIPLFLLPLPPSRIEVVIPDQIDWPSELWSQLDARDSVHVDSSRIVKLGIARHLCRALEHWSSSAEDFEKHYRSLPFGSTIRMSSLKANVQDIEFVTIPNEWLPEFMLSAEALRNMWGFERGEMPPEIDYTQLRFEKHLSSEVILISLPPDSGEKRMVFKSQKSTPAILYHELKNLLSIPPARTIIRAPQYLVTLACPTQSENRVCGFLLEYYELGSLQDILPRWRLDGTLKLRQQVNWAKEVTSALIHLYSTPGLFYSDLRMDQILLSHNDDGSDTVVLIDFEQSRNVYNWAPPEIYYLEWVAELGSWEFARTDQLSKETMDKYSGILARYLLSRKYPLPLRTAGAVYDNPPHGWYFPWLASTLKEQESGTVYELGKALWCLFEGVGDADIILGRSNVHEAEQRFPEFRRTPEPLRDLIRNCTAGAREWIDGPIKIYRREGKIFPLGKTGLNGEPEGTLEETKDTIKSFWQNEMSKAEAFLLARERYDKGEATKDDLSLLHYLRRPTLNEVFQSLEKFEESVL
jgi:hypothetical protein